MSFSESSSHFYTLNHGGEGRDSTWLGKDNASMTMDHWFSITSFFWVPEGKIAQRVGLHIVQVKTYIAGITKPND